MSRHGVDERRAIQREQPEGRLCDDGRRAGDVTEQRYLSEEAAGPELSKPSPFGRDHGSPFDDRKEAIAFITLLEDG